MLNGWIRRKSYTCNRVASVERAIVSATLPVKSISSSDLDYDRKSDRGQKVFVDKISAKIWLRTCFDKSDIIAL